MKIIFSELIYCKIYNLLVIPYLREKAQFAKGDRKALYEDFIRCVPEFIHDYGKQEISDCTEAHQKLLTMRLGDLIAGTLEIFRVFCVAQNLDEWTVSGKLGQMKRDIQYKTPDSVKEARIQFDGSMYSAYDADGKVIMNMIDEGMLREMLIKSGYAIAAEPGENAKF